MKKIISVLGIVLLLFVITIGIVLANTKKKEDSDKIQIIATLFPQYDFAKQVGGDKVEVEILLPSGIESHTFEPTPKDIIKINNSDLFIYTGEYMEPWAQTITQSIDSDTKIIDISGNINLINLEEFEEKYVHDHDETEEHTHEEHGHEYDPHIWLNPLYAIEMLTDVKNALCEIDPDNKEYYEENAANYIMQLTNLDEEIEKSIKDAKRDRIAFGGPFAYSYFIERYNLEFISAYESCGEQAEPSTAKVKEIIDDMKDREIPVIFYQELSSGNIAKTIAQETGAEILVFHTVHNVSKEDIKQGTTYYSLMKNNLENLKKALND